ncbi:MAG: cbb3-type cytochrome oxidase assembly protein [Chloroflexota bacterium]
MKAKMRLMRMLVGMGGVMMIVAPSTAFAHDNLGGDELATANWMLVGALITIVLGILAGLWAARSGQFSNIEDSKYTMLETAEDYDAIMAAYDERELAAKAARTAEKQAANKTPIEQVIPGGKQKQAHI